MALPITDIDKTDEDYLLALWKAIAHLQRAPMPLRIADRPGPDVP
jgi:hypothetical protein